MYQQKQSILFRKLSEIDLLMSGSCASKSTFVVQKHLAIFIGSYMPLTS